MVNDDPKHDPANTETGHTETGHGTDGRGKSRRRPPPTLDLAATEVTPGSATPGTATPGKSGETTGETPVADSAALDATGAGETPVADTPATDAPPEPVHAAELPGATSPPEAPKRQMGLIAGLVVAVISGVIGGAVALAVVSTFYGAEQNADAITQLEARALDLRQRLEAIEQAGGAPAAPAPAANAELPQELATRLDALESGLSAMGERVTTLANAPAPAPVAPPPAASPEEVATLGSRLDGLQQRVAAIPAPPPAASPQDLATANARIGAVEQKLATVAQQQQASGQGAAQLVALSALQMAVTGGQPFATELKATRALLGAGGEGLAALEPTATSGFSTGPALAEQLKVATTPVATETAPATDAGVLDRLVESAKGLVTVRRSDDAPVGATAEAVATARAQLQRGDYAGALATLNALPTEGRTIVAPVIESLEQRQAALATVAGLSQHVLASLAGGTQ